MPEQISLTDALSEILASLSADPNFPDPDYLAYHQLLKDRIIYLETEVNESMLRLHKQIMLWNAEDAGKPVEERKPIRIVIMSYGGIGDFMWMLVDAIQMSKTPVYTYNIGVAHSSAGLIFMAGQKRFMTPNATMIIHEGSAGFEGDAGKVLDASESYKKVLKKMKDYILAKTDIPKATLNRKKANDWELNAEDCLKFKVCDEIIDSIDSIL